MCSLLGSSFYPQFGLRSEAVSPQAAVAIDNGLNAHKQDIGNKLEKTFVKDIGNEDIVRNHLKSDIKSESLLDRYPNHIRSSSSDLDSDPEGEELTLKKREESFSERNRNFGYSQHLPSNISPYTSAFSAEEARLRFSLESAKFKERLGSIGLSSYRDEELHRRYSLQESAPDSSKQPVSSPDSSPRPHSLQSSPLQSYKGQDHGQRSIHDISFEEQDSNSFLPRIKEGLFFCHLCSFSGTTQADFDQHMTVHFEHICPHCDYKSRTEGRLKRHIKDFHTEDPDGGYNRTMPGRPKVFRCKQCEYSTTDKIEFWTHSRSHIKEDKLLQCPRCPFVTEYKHHLEYHLRNHFGSKPFKCPKCNYACVNKSMLNSHMKSHTNVYQYRCADCTYATKYCHSLKLHLRKYNHKPAAVLNSDGSLPQGVDATASGLSLMAKRGPPRGPRGPRKDKLEPSHGNFLPMPPSPMAAIPGLPGMMSPFWPLMQGQMPGRLPHPMSLGPRFGPQFARFPTFGIKTEEMKSPPPLSSEPFKCNLCSFVGTSREALTSHLVKIHATENQDLFSMFGLSSETLLEENQKRMNALSSSFRTPMKSPKIDPISHGIDFNLNGKKESNEMKKIKRENEEAMNMSPFAFVNGKFQGTGNVKDEGIDILKQMTLKFGSGPVDLKRKRPVEPVPPVSEVSVIDSPLDLTKPRSLPPVYQQEANYKPEDVEGEHSSGENSVYSNEVMSPTPRKRSRKGKAYKLDTLCMKLQEKQGNIYGSDEDSSAENDEMYTSDLLPVEADGHSPEDYSINDNSYADVDSDFDKQEDMGDEKNVDVETTGDMPEVAKDIIETDDGDNERSRSSVKEEGKDAGDSEKLPEEDLRKIHASLNMLNETSCVNKDSVDDNEKAINDNGVSRYNDDVLQEDEMVKKSPSPPEFPSHNRRKPVAAAIQRGADIAWKILNDPKMTDPTRLLRNGNNGHKLELSPLDKKLWLDAPYCTKSQKGDYECPHCQISFGDCIMYTMHMGYHGYKDPYKCNMCGDTCKDRVEFFLHIARAAHN